MDKRKSPVYEVISIVRTVEREEGLRAEGGRGVGLWRERSWVMRPTSVILVDWKIESLWEGQEFPSSTSDGPGYRVRTILL